jgi:uncharacterized membrane protein YdjX (TVP38/TMEM64 family)
MKKSAAIRLLSIAWLIGAIAAILIVFPIKQYLQQFLEWIEGLGPWGPVVLAAAYIPATVFLIPGTVLTLGAGAIFGLVTGTIAISLGSTAGAAAAFWVGRTLARGWVEARIAGNPRFQAIDRAVGEHGFKIVLLTRLSPIFPFNLLNYAFSLTKVRFRDYLLGSWIGMFPGTVMYVYLGSVVRRLADLATGKVEGGPAQQVLFFVGLVATVVVTIYVTRIARKALNQATTPGQEGSTQSK